jgi:glycosyltransferase involved in cell wall biosynthesis
MNTALFLVAVPDLSGGGGAERQFSNFYDYFNSPENLSKNKLFLITDHNSFVNLRKAGLLRNESNVILLDTYQFTIKNFFTFVWKLISKNVKLIHVVNTYSHYDFNLIYKFTRIQKLLNIKISVNNEVAELIEEVKEYNLTGTLMTRYIKSFKIVLETIKPSGIYTWYQSVAEELKKSDLVINKNCVIKSSTYCFTDLKKFIPGKSRKNEVVYASRLCKEKNPLLLIDAVKFLRDNHEHEIGDYKFMVYGRGELEAEMKTRIEKYGLQDFFVMTFSTAMHEIFAQSKIFVSTQPLENFTSLSMLEAMASGNVIVAKNTGQTHLFAMDEKNAFLYENDSAEDLGLILLRAIQLDDAGFSRMSSESTNLAINHHNVQNFSNEIESFFSEVLQK